MPPESTSLLSMLRWSSPIQATYSVTTGRAPPPNCTRRAVAMSPTPFFGSNSTPQAFNSLMKSALGALPLSPIGPLRAPTSATGSTKASTLPPPSTN